MTTDYSYVGGELDLFATAVNWKSYLRRQIQPYLGEEVLEVGAGLGGTTRLLCDGTQKRWICLEPDKQLVEHLKDRTQRGELPPCCTALHGTLRDLPKGSFDCLLYIDVLEHIEDDRAELERAAEVLRSGGRLVVLSPAHQWLYTPFDRAIGHFRRYSLKKLRDLTPRGMRLSRGRYLDAVGLFASLGNRLLLHSSMPTPRQVAFWDRVLVRLSRLVDPCLGHSFGKSALAVWTKTFSHT